MKVSEDGLNQIMNKLNQELDTNFINKFESELGKCRENKLSKDSEEPKLLFDNSLLTQDFSDFFDFYSNQSNDDSNSPKNLISKSLCLFKSLKYISEKSEDDQIRQQILIYLNDSVKLLNSKNLANNEILFPYYYYLTSLDIIDSDILDINSFKNKYNFKEQLIKCLKVNNFDNKIGNDFYWITNFMTNPLNLIHYLEFLLYSCDEFLRFQGIFTSSSYFSAIKSTKKFSSNKSESNFNNFNNHAPKLNDILTLLDKGINLIFCYFHFSLKFYIKNNLSIFDKIFCIILKAFISFSLEIIINNKEKIVDMALVSNLIGDYLYTGLDLKTPHLLTNELYIFGLMATLITSLKYSGKINLFNMLSEINCNYINEESNGRIQKENFNAQNEIMIYLNLINSLNFYLMKKYQKGMDNCQNNIKLINVDDFILNDFFLYPSAYDTIKKTNKNLKEKIYWNLGEICNYLINKKLKFPRIFKGTILLHLINVPDDKALLNNLIQYYYDNKKINKAIVLCQKVLSDLKYTSLEELNKNKNFIEKDSQINFDIYNLVILVFIKIKLYQKKYNEAKELAILNYERLTNKNTKIFGYQIDKTYLYKTYKYLGYSLLKLALSSSQYEQRKKLFEQSKYYFEQANLKFVNYNTNNNENSETNSRLSFMNNQNQTNNEYKYYELCNMIYLGKFEEIENYFQSKLLSPQNYINYDIKFKNIDEEIKFVSLHIINLIGLLNYDKAYQLSKDAIKYFCNKNSNYLYQIYLEYFYIGIYREYVYLEEKNTKFSFNLQQRIEKISTELIDVLKRLILLLEMKKKRLEDEILLNNKQTKTEEINTSESNNNQIQDELSKIYKKQFEANEIKFSFNRYSKGQINYNIYIINSLTLKIIKMFSILCLKLIKIPGVKDFGHINILKAQLTEIIEKEVNDPSIFDTTKSIEEDEINNEILLINSIKWILNVNNNLNKDNNIVVENLKQVIINDPTNLEAMKLLIEQLFNKNDLSNVYVFCNTALKINEKEQGLWSLMAEYYRLNKDEMKYYECSMCELMNSSKHRNSFLNDILDINL